MVDLFETPQWSLRQADKEAALFPQLMELTHKHYNASPEYRRQLDALWPNWRSAKRVEDIPYLPVQIFKSHRLASIPDAERKITMTSSGTTGAAVSSIAVDTPTAALQTKGLSAVVTAVIGKKRPPMLVLDSKEVVRDPKLLTARGAGVLGMMRYGREHEFALDANMQLDREKVSAFLSKHSKEPFFMFGFTFMVWLYLYEPLADGEFDLSNGILVHSGGWKKLADQAVDNSVFRQRLVDRFGLRKVHNFYGMVEQMGSIFIEGEEHGALSAPNFSDVIIRDPITLEPLPPGREGLIQVVSLIPHSYPGHSLLTEDLGAVVSVDSGAGGRYGKTVKVIGRLPRVELRGCSDVHADTLRASAGGAR